MENPAEELSGRELYEAALEDVANRIRAVWKAVKEFENAQSEASRANIDSRGFEL